MIKHNYITLGAIGAALAVIMGAFGAHGLKSIVAPELLSVFKTGVTYHMWHALGLCLIGALQLRYPAAKLLVWSGRMMYCGILLFSGSLYLLVLLNLKWLGMITPIGGLAFIAGWLLLAIFSKKFLIEET